MDIDVHSWAFGETWDVVRVVAYTYRKAGLVRMI